tara:strand:+ start:359 stop:556 length:198 start_codon:yes stop_codon:yes gene_type:complete
MLLKCYAVSARHSTERTYTVYAHSEEEAMEAVELDPLGTRSSAVTLNEEEESDHEILDCSRDVND